MKTIKIFAIIIATFAVNNSSWGQNYAGEKTATTAENVDLTSWIAPVGVAAPRYLLKVVAEEVDPSVVKSGVNEWNSPNREFPIGYPTGYETAQWAPSLLPGTYYISGEEKGKVLYDISYITNLWVGINQTATTASPHLTSFNGTITAQNFVSLKLSGIFVSGKFTNELIKIVNGTVQSMGVHKDEYQISESGDYAVSVIYTASDYSYSADTYLKVNITGTTTPTVDNVIVSPASASVNKGAGQAFTASVQGQNNPGQGVSWTIEGNTSAATTISSTGYLSVAENENATQLTVRATSTVDLSKSGTATVNVITPQPKHTINLSAVPPNGGTVSGGGEFDAGTTQSVVATPASNWKFESWYENGNLVSTAASYSFILDRDRSLVAQFQEIPPAKYQVVFTGNISDATITLDNRTQTAQYVFEDVAIGTYEYTISKEGYQTLSGNLEVVDQQVVVPFTLVEIPPEVKSKVPIFEGLRGEYSVGTAPVTLKIIGEGTMGLSFTYTVYTINSKGEPENPISTLTFVSEREGEYLINATSGNEVSIWTIVKVN